MPPLLWSTLVARREWIISIAIAMTDSSIAAVGNYIPSLVLRDFTCTVDRLRLSIVSGRVSRISFAEHGPSAVLTLHHMLMIAHKNLLNRVLKRTADRSAAPSLLAPNQKAPAVVPVFARIQIAIAILHTAKPAKHPTEPWWCRLFFT